MPFDQKRFDRLFQKEGMSYLRDEKALAIIASGGRETLMFIPIDTLSDIEDFEGLVDRVRNIHHQQGAAWRRLHRETLYTVRYHTRP